MKNKYLNATRHNWLLEAAYIKIDEIIVIMYIYYKIHTICEVSEIGVVKMIEQSTSLTDHEL